MNKNYAEELKKRTFYCVDSDENLTGEEVLNGFIEYEYSDAFGKPFCGTFTEDELDHLYCYVEYDALGKNGSLIEVASLEQIEQAYKEACVVSSSFVPSDLAELRENFELVKFRFLASEISDYSGNTLYCIAVDGKIFDGPYYMTSARIVADEAFSIADGFEFKGESGHTIDIMVI